MDHQTEIDALKKVVANQDKELEMLKRLDEIRDTAANLEEMMRGVTKLLVETLDAAFCTLFLVEAGCPSRKPPMRCGTAPSTSVSGR